MNITGVTNTASEMVRCMRLIENDLRSKADAIELARTSLSQMLEAPGEYDEVGWLIEVGLASTTTVSEVVHCSNVNLHSFVRYGNEAMSHIGRPQR